MIENYTKPTKIIPLGEGLVRKIGIQSLANFAIKVKMSENGHPYLICEEK